jgi:tRNA(Ile)-lysidine synthetase-like protein
MCLHRYHCPNRPYDCRIDPLISAIFSVPPGRWAVAVSGGADSLALLRLVCDRRPDVAVHVIHLNHETRGVESDADACLVAEVAKNLSVLCTVARLSEIVPRLTPCPKNASSRYRAARIELFGQVVSQNNLLGVILAHHADDQAETVLVRLLRGSAPAGLTGMSVKSHLGSLFMLRPLLGVEARLLRDYLLGVDQPWREDASNASPKYLRNRLRPMIRRDAQLRRALFEMADGCRALKTWITETAPSLSPEFPTDALGSLPPVLGRESARQWLISMGSPPGKLSEHVLNQLVAMAADAATAARQDFPGNVVLGRKSGRIFQIAAT